MPLVDRMIRKLTIWKASHLSRDERLALVRHVLTDMLVHILLAMDINPPILKLVIRVIHDFCVAWPQGCHG